MEITTFVAAKRQLAKIQSIGHSLGINGVPILDMSEEQIRQHKVDTTSEDFKVACIMCQDDISALLQDELINAIKSFKQII